jgi:hypothetical protein
MTPAPGRRPESSCAGAKLSLRPGARSSAGERPLHTREVAGSIPAAPTTETPGNRLFSCGPLPGDEVTPPARARSVRESPKRTRLCLWGIVPSAWTRGLSRCGVRAGIARARRDPQSAALCRRGTVLTRSCSTFIRPPRFDCEALDAQGVGSGGAHSRHPPRAARNSLDPAAAPSDRRVQDRPGSAHLTGEQKAGLLKGHGYVFAKSD